MPSSSQQASQESFGDKVKRMASNCCHATGLCCFKVKEQSQIALLEKKIVNRQRQFGVDYITMIDDKAPQENLKKCLQQAVRDIDELQGQINDHYDNIDHKEADTQGKIAQGAHDDNDDEDDQRNDGNSSSQPSNTRKKKPNTAGGGGGSPGGKRPSNNNGAGRGGNNGGGGSPTKSRNPAKAGRGGDGGRGRPNNNNGKNGHSGAVPKEEVPEAYRNVDPSKWKLKELQFNGSAVYDTKGKEENITGQTIEQGIKRFKANPGKYTAMLYQTSMRKENWPAANCKYTLIHREGTSNYRPQGTGPSGWMTILIQQYEVIPPLPDNVLPKSNRDKFTDAMTFQKRKLHSGKNKPILPGRGMGVGDTPLLKIIGDVDPSDISQGQVGNCWLLSGISSLAEFDGAVKRVFRKTKNLDNMPMEGPNMYTVTLWDLKTWKEVDIHIDERLACSPDGNGLLASKPSEDGELWVPYLEKALAVHCGGWDKIVGGQCTHAWALLTGCKEQYTIRINPKTKKYGCYAKYDPYKKKWADHANSPHDSDSSMWRVAWPKVGGGGGMDLELTENQLFQRLVAWDKQNYIVGAGTKGTSDKHSTAGLVDNHAYSVIESHSNVAGTGIDLLKVRNPWGSGEIEDGEFDDDGPGWDKYPQIKKLLNPVVADDGIFWVTKKEFFHFYQTIYLSASDMTEFLED